VQQRLESSPAGRIAISVFVVFTLVCVVFWNLPDSEIKRKSLGVVRPYMTATSLEQNWGVFAPDPRRQTLEVIARVRYADGGQETLQVPRGNDFFGGYWDYRWWKWVEWVRQDARRDLWKPAALWFAGRAAADGRTPTQVVLVRRWYDILPPGPGPDRTEWREAEFYTLRLTSSSGGRG
jgi:hypothetical protein